MKGDEGRQSAAFLALRVHHQSLRFRLEQLETAARKKGCNPRQRLLDTCPDSSAICSWSVCPQGHVIGIDRNSDFVREPSRNAVC